MSLKKVATIQPQSAEGVNVEENVAPVETDTDVEDVTDVDGGEKKVKNPSNKKDINYIKTVGEQFYDSMTSEQQAAVGSKSGTIVLEKALAGFKKGTTRTTVNKQNLNKEPIVFGFLLKFDADTSVDLFSDPKKGHRVVVAKRGQSLQLTSEEAAYLIGQPQFGGFFENAKVYVRGTAKGYTGTLTLQKGSLRDGHILTIDKMDEKSGQYEVLPEYKESFGFMYEKINSQRPGLENTSVDSEKNVQNTAFGFAQYIKTKKLIAK